jgi:hypothetical protein
VNPWEQLCIDLLGPYNIKSNVKGVIIPPLKCVTMIDPATGWFKIKQYNDKKSITVAKQGYAIARICVANSVQSA